MLISFICMFLIYSSSYNKIPWMRWLINKRNLFFTVLGAEKSKLKEPVELMSGDSLIPDSYMALFSYYVLTCLKQQESSLRSFIKSLIPFMRLHHHDLIISQGPPKLLTPSLMNLEGRVCNHSVYSTHLDYTLPYALELIHTVFWKCFVMKGMTQM